MSDFQQELKVNQCAQANLANRKEVLLHLKETVKLSGMKGYTLQMKKYSPAKEQSDFFVLGKHHSNVAC